MSLLLQKPIFAFFHVVRASGKLQIILRNRIGLDASGNLQWTQIKGSREEITFDNTFRFDYFQVLDTDGGNRLSSAVWAGEARRLPNNDIQVVLDVLNPLVDVDSANIGNDNTHNCYGLYDFVVSARRLFAPDGSVMLQSLMTDCVSFGRDKWNVDKLVSLAELAAAAPRYAHPVRATRAPEGIHTKNFSFLYRLFGGQTNDLSITPYKTGVASIRLGPAGLVGPKPAKRLLGFEASAAVQCAKPLTLILDPRFTADDPLNPTFKPRSGQLEVRVVNDAFHAQPGIGADTLVMDFDAKIPWYVIVEGVPAEEAFTSIWNELIARPYLRSLRTVEDAADLTFVPLLSPVAPGRISDCDLLFDLVSDTPEPLADSEMVDPGAPTRGNERGGQFGSPVLVAFRASGGVPFADFIADATFPGLLTHGREAVKRRVNVTVGPNTLEWFDAAVAPQTAPQLTIRLQSIDGQGNADVGGELRVGALDLVAPGKVAGRAVPGAAAGKIDITYHVTFDTADTLAVNDGSEKARLRARRLRATLPRRGTAIPRLSTSIDRFELAGVQPGSQDPPPDAASAEDAVLQELADAPESGNWRNQRERRIRANLRRSAPIVLNDPGVDKASPAVEGQPFFITGREITEKDRNRSLVLTLHRVPKVKGGNSDSPQRTIVIDPEPLTVGLVEVPPFALPLDEQAETDGEIANWQTSEAEGARWEIARITDGFNLYLPPQTIGEAAEKGAPWPPISDPPPAPARTIDYRLGTLAKLKLRSSYFKQRYAEAPWNLRRVLGYPGQRAPGAALVTVRMELLYGLGARFSGPAMRLTELGARLGAVREPLPARPSNVRRRSSDATRPTNQLDVEAEVYDRFRDASAALTKTYNTRLGVLEAYREAGEGEFSVEDNVAFALRINGSNDADIVSKPWLPDRAETQLRGGATWGFESRNIYDEVASVPTSTRGQIVDPSFSAIGGSGFVRAFFASGKSRIVTTARFGRTSNYAIERIGRIGVFWNIAKHVIVYERTVLPPDQFESEQAGQHLGRPVLRKVREYVDILEPERLYPEKDAPPKSRGFVEACLFRTRRIPVNGAWGHDVPGGWVIPLWKADADADQYPKPDVRLRLSAAHTDAAAAVPGRLKDPGQLLFFTSTVEKTDNPNLWPACADVDYVNMPKPAPVGEATLDPGNPDGTAPDDLMREPLFGRCTFDIDTSGLAANLTQGRSNADPIGAVVETVTMARATPADAGQHKAAGVIALRQDVERISATLLRFEGVLDHALGGARGVLAECLVRTPASIKDRILREIGGLRKSKQLVSKAAAEARAAVAEAAARAKQANDAVGAWEESAESVRAAFEQRLVAEVDARTAALVQSISELRRDAEFVVADGKGAALRRIDDAMSQFDRLFASGAGVVEDVARRLRKALSEAERELAAVRSAVIDTKNEVEGQIDAFASGDPAVKAKLVALLVSYSGVAVSRLGALERTAEQLPKQVGADTREKLRGALSLARRQVAGFRDAATAAISKADPDSITAGPKAVAKAHVRQIVTACAAPLGDVDQGLAALHHGLDSAEAGWLGIFAGLRKSWDDQRTFIKDKFDEPGDNAQRLRNALDEVSKKLPDRSAVVKAAQATVETLSTFADQLSTQLDATKAEIAGAINGVIAMATLSVDELEKHLLDAIDVTVDQLQQAAEGVADALGKAADALAREGKHIADLLGKPELAGLAEARRVLEEGYARLSQAPTFQNPAETLALIRAAGSAPILPNLQFNRERIAYFFDDARQAIRTTPVVALMNRLGDDLKALGIRLPTGELLDRLVPQGLERVDFSKLFPDLGGLKLDGLFKNLRLPSSLNDNVKLTHGFNKASLTAWAKAEAKSDFPPRSDIFSLGPLNLAIVGANFAALADILVSADGTTQRKTTADIVGDWELGFAGRTLVTLEKTRIHYEDGRGIDVDIDPRRVRLDSAVKFLSDIIKSYSDPNSGFFLEMLEEGGLPAGLAARIDLPMSPLSFGAFSIWGLRFTSALGLHLPAGSGKRDFALSTKLALGRKSEPFILRVWILVGGGWLETEAKHFPGSGLTESRVSVGLTAGLGLDFAFGPCYGYVFVMFGVYAEFRSGEQSQLSIAVTFLVRGGIVILGRFNIGLNLLLELVYNDDGSAVGHGTLEMTFTICWCCKITIRQAVTYQLRQGSGTLSALRDPPHYLNHFA